MVKAQQLVRRLQVLWSRPDFRRNPLKAIAKRCIWHARWWLRADPWELRMPGGLRIVLPRSGACAVEMLNLDWSTIMPRTAKCIPINCVAIGG